MKTLSFRQLLLTLFPIILFGGASMARAVEEPEHVLLGKIGTVEIREYLPVVQAVTPLASSAHTSDGFRRLAGFIFGGNEGEQKIAMTAPVQESLGVDQPELAFTMPRGYSLDSLPNPKDSSVKLVEVPARTVAVIRFSGWATDGKIERYTGELLDALVSRQIEINSEPMLNQYNPPWTAPFLRRNEIMIEIVSPPELELGNRQASLLNGEHIYSF